VSVVWPSVSVTNEVLGCYSLMYIVSGRCGRSGLYVNNVMTIVVCRVIHGFYTYAILTTASACLSFI
jgi:hypothetical protein